MLPSKNRLVDKADFEKVYKNGRFFSANGVSVSFAPNDLKKTRVGFSVGKKFSKKAVQRNRARRLLRESVHLHLKEINNGFDIVVSCRFNTEKQTLAETEKTILFILRKCRLLI